MCNSGSIMPQPGFLEGLRDLCSRYETALIFDEVITGFRLALGGAQEVFGVTPDLATYAKGIASGFALSAVAGKAEFMDLISSGQVAHAGTYNSNPVVIAAGLATVQYLKAHREAVYRQLNRTGKQLREGLQACLHAAATPALVAGKGPVVQVSLTDQSSILNYRDWARRDTRTYQRLVTELAERGIRTIPRGTWYLSTEHTEEDVDQTLSKFEDALKALKPPFRA
jgi:glutamate-1-semialdehyde 2,1-aminomutase